MPGGYKLKYFDFKGRGEIVRLMFALTGQSYEDYRIQFSDWPKEKPDTPFGWLPTLTFNGQTYSESMAIAKYLAREYDYGGKNNLEMLGIDQITGIVQDVLKTLVKFNFEKDETKKAQYKKEAYEETLPKFLNAFDKILTQTGTGYYVGNKLTVADVAVFDVLENRIEDSLMSKYPKIKANMAKVTSNDKIKAYLATRKHSDF